MLKRCLAYGVVLIFLALGAGCSDDTGPLPDSNVVKSDGIGDSDGGLGDTRPPTPDQKTPTPDKGMADAGGPAVVLAASLSGEQQMPPVTSQAAGSATVTLSADGTSIEVVVNISNIKDATAAHIHLGKPGENGPLLFGLASATFFSPLKKTLTAADFKKVGAVVDFAAALKVLRQGGAYINVHTKANPGGELRGHIGPATLKATLSGAQQAPPLSSTARGTATVTVDAQQSMVDVNLHVGRLGGIVAAHIHLGRPGKNGGLIFPLATKAFTSPLRKTLKAADLGKGVFKTMADAIDALLSGRAYINVHTTANKGGELRGHLGPAAIRATLSGGQQSTPVASAGSGRVLIAINGEQTQLGITLDHKGLSGITAAHIHAGGVGQDGPLLFGLASAAFASPLRKTLNVGDLKPAAGQGIKTFADAVNAILGGRAYVNLHTAANKSGELRGQVGAVTLQAKLSGSEQVPPVTTSASGSGMVTLDALRSSVDVSLSYSKLNTITAAHIHLASKGKNGGLLFPLASTTFASPLKKTLTETDFKVLAGKADTFEQALDAILSGGTYFNVHTSTKAGGELRGQITAK